MQMASRLGGRWLVCLVLMVGVALADDGRRNEARQRLLLSSSWTYQLQSANPAEIDRTGYDVIVIDAFFGGGKREVDRLRARPGGARRLIFAYMSIGEAEVYRYYWQRCCSGGKRPTWIGAENKRWPGNYAVQFWDADWKAILYEEEDSYLSRIVEAGFDGVYLDRVDAHEGKAGPGIAPRAEMIGLVRAIADKARKLKPGFLVIAQNAEELATDAGYLAAIDGIAKEDLLYGVDGEGRRNKDTMIRASTEHLRQAQAAGRHILVVEYLKDVAAIEKARTEILELGFVPYFAPRTLERLQVENLELDDSH
jgi:cysteinyl-tRNA synthetase